MCILDDVANEFGANYSEFLRSSPYPRKEITDVWISELWRAEACLARVCIARGETGMHVLGAAVKIEKSSRLGEDVVTARAIASSYLDGFNGKPLKYSETSEINTLSCRVSDKNGNYYSTLQYTWKRTRGNPGCLDRLP